MRRGLGLLAAALALGVPATGAAAATIPVQIQFQAFAPSELEVLPGDTVEWTNGSERTHTVTADDESFGSGDLLPEDTFSQTFGAPGRYGYHCTIHLGMTGDVLVERVILDGIPAVAVPQGSKVELTGRAAEASAPVEIQRDRGDGTFAAVGMAMPASDGSWKATVPAEHTAEYRAVSGGQVSQTRRLLVTDRKIRARAVQGGVEVTVSPALPGARVLLEVKSRERFGWWPAQVGRLDYISRATFRLRGPATVRAVLADKDGWTAVATSPTLLLRRPARR